jgi:hypothetical protein
MGAEGLVRLESCAGDGRDQLGAGRQQNLGHAWPFTISTGFLGTFRIPMSKGSIKGSIVAGDHATSGVTSSEPSDSESKSESESESAAAAAAAAAAEAPIATLHRASNGAIFSVSRAPAGLAV